MYRKMVLLILILLLVISSGCTTSSNTQTTDETTTGSLTISSSPPGSEIYLDGVYRGTTPLTISDVPEGFHTLELQCHGYSSWSTSVEINGGTELSMNATLAPIVVPTTIPTTVPTTMPTPTPDSNPILGCWKMEFSKGGGIHAYILELQSGGSGRYSFDESVSVEITWSQDPNSAVVYAFYTNPNNYRN